MSSLTARVYDFLPTTSAITGYAEDKECSFSGVTSIRQTLEAGAERLGLEFSESEAWSGLGVPESEACNGLGCAGKRGLQWLGVCRKARLAVAWSVPESEAWVFQKAKLGVCRKASVARAPSADRSWSESQFPEGADIVEITQFCS